MVFPLLQHVPYDNKYYTSKTGLIMRLFVWPGIRIFWYMAIKYILGGAWIFSPKEVEYNIHNYIFFDIYHKMNNLLNKILLQIHFPSEMISSSEFFCSHYTERFSSVLVHNGRYEKSCTVARQQSFHHLHLHGQFLKERQKLN